MLFMAFTFWQAFSSKAKAETGSHSTNKKIRRLETTKIIMTELQKC